LHRHVVQLGQAILAQSGDVARNGDSHLDRDLIRRLSQRFLGVILAAHPAPRPRSFAAVCHLESFSSRSLILLGF
jgi:hypothetical protein